MKLKTNKIWAIVVLALVITTTTFAQQRGPENGQGGNQQGPPEVPNSKEIKTMVSELSKEILLSGEQETEILALYKAHFKEVKSKTSSGMPKREDMEALKDDFETDVKTVLTKDQQKLYTAYLIKNNKRRRPERN
ncbi:hypothetical protein MHL31_11235 [Lutibacter sp. A80]|uniref:hypothetical protein n=1 Tax=Lutibacter sp. A80 TaxID=2918453 RepID=UPI001F05D26C|nr:hypothetical protein [Lutibacter sp. A80]UMB59651.1 hypothetical protein MHL31_11235 [Lutibacter sp. A80]